MSGQHRRRGSDAAIALACAFLALWLFSAACELSFRIWIDWAILWPVLIVVCVPTFAITALARPKTITLVALAGVMAWLVSAHTDAYAYLLVHWVRSPGVSGSKGLEPETVKWLYRYAGAAPLLITAALTAYSAPR